AALDLAAGGIATENGRVKLNEFLQSVSNPKVYAAGDAASSGPPLTPVSSHDGKVVAQNLLDGNQHRPDYRGVPSVAFTIPPIAAVGLSEAEARAKGIKFRLHSEKASDWYTARRLNESVYGFKTLVGEDTDRILGAHLVGPHAEEVINLFGLAIRHGLTTKEVKTAIFDCRRGPSAIGYMLSLPITPVANRHCPKCQWPAAQAWMAAREAELLPVPTSTWCSRCRPRSERSPTRTRPSSTDCCSRPQSRRSPPLPAIPSTLAPTSASPLS